MNESLSGRKRWWKETVENTDTPSGRVFGYDDVYPVTAGGKVFTRLVLMAGMCIMAEPAGILAAAMAQIRMADRAMRKIDGNGPMPVPVARERDAKKE